MTYFLKSIISFIALCLLTACGNDFAAMESGELRKRAYLCSSDDNATAAELQICENIKRECLRRQEAGQFDC